MGNDYVREIVVLKRQLEVACLRATDISFKYEVPARFLGNTHAAYDSGYEAGWRGWKFKDPYTSHRHQLAYERGYSAGEKDLNDAAKKVRA